ncbi:MAG: UDP-N-acetylmuramoyl-tripeptide--D-alanyl-D-alanine ligase [Methylovulum sp.]|uniref:UDP-N-acetylmuramoyl-tripeptide--D-alanyl-D- alanine ligase n=1 Tax=Methylovulum sp. TaxID=1916980 RepID=UPI002607B403|nr:UDP-N-acetylmuramoyl-tripeptide--D-alanyl-D-alanine ligase [Methylovulum sp.]MDD2722927.1 UDP-N-acetylmuramoyl-tripeptide--D-alanyl-D-alanine ligase [Methylovulum sp.]MDD5126209.1 UDP-N-acetylmuramoyl-tripeptide--D-alanyl-D-alanine ligase [Methylovulum sp.]
MHMLLSEIAAIVGGRLVGADLAISAASIDTRTLQAGQLYVAVKGERFDGNEFMPAAEQAGAAAAIVHAGTNTYLPHIVVADSRLALAELAGAWRRKANVKVVGVTGSNGKTTVKEMTAAILSVAGNTLFTQGNLNNDIGVPLTLLRLDETHRYAVIEMGANHPQEIAYTSRYAQADVVILNNAGAAHLEGFGNLDGVARAKGEIIETLQADGIAILNRDDCYFDYWQGLAGTRQILSFGFHQNADVCANNIKTELCTSAFRTVFQLTTPQGETEAAINLAGRHNVLNALAATAAALALGLRLPQIVQGLANVQPVKGRLQPLVGSFGSFGSLGNRIIDDTYNANASSLKVGLDVLMDCGGKPWLVLGAFGELGPESEAMHTEIGAMIKASGVVSLLATGDHARFAVASFGDGAEYFAAQEDLIAALKQRLKGDETILIKGSRAQHMEYVVAALVGRFEN